MLTVSQLTKRYGSQEVLRGIDMQLEKGRVYGVVGVNGAGKTTLFKCLAGLIPFEGEVQSERADMQARTGFLETTPWFFSRITGREYITLLLRSRQPRGPLPPLRNLFGLPLEQYASTYSTGMKKKLALTAILHQENDLLILDEPFNGVDIQSNLMITELIRRLAAKGKTIVIASHILATLQECCEVIFLLEEGKTEEFRMAEDGRFGDLAEKMRKVAIEDQLREWE